MIAAERETTVSVSDADEVVTIWTARRRDLQAMRGHPRFTEIDAGWVEGQEWARFTIAVAEWSPVSGARRPGRIPSAAQLAALAGGRERRAA